MNFFSLKFIVYNEHLKLNKKISKRGVTKILLNTLRGVKEIRTKSYDTKGGGLKISQFC